MSIIEEPPADPWAMADPGLWDLAKRLRRRVLAGKEVVLDEVTCQGFSRDLIMEAVRTLELRGRGVS
ncbi:MAG: hypothetical protein WCF04_00215 [Candidatus Nanopelagicales bacterium]